MKPLVLSLMIALVTSTFDTDAMLLVKSQRYSSGGRKNAARHQHLATMTSLDSQVLGRGVVFRHLLIRNHQTQTQHSVKVLELHRLEPSWAFKAFKAGEHYEALERLADIAARTSSLDQQAHKPLYGMVNANFWRDVLHTPIGLAVIDGEVVEMTPYKEWSSACIDTHNRLFIDHIHLTGIVMCRNRTFSIQSVNRRLHEADVVLYNHFAGTHCPPLAAEPAQSTQPPTQAVAVLHGQQLDGTERAVSQQEKKHLLQHSVEQMQHERHTLKIAAVYTKSPLLNEPIPCTITAVTRGTLAIPAHGVVISFGSDSTLAKAKPRVGDVLTLTFRTNVHSRMGFVTAICGTPRLVRQGVAAHEALSEGATGRRFIHARLPRTALGVDKSGSRLYLVALEGSNLQTGTSGATLQELAWCMKQVGAFEALNLDGGSSTSMVIASAQSAHHHTTVTASQPLERVEQWSIAPTRFLNVVKYGGAEAARKISVGLGVVGIRQPSPKPLIPTQPTKPALPLRPPPHPHNAQTEQ